MYIGVSIFNYVHLHMYIDVYLVYANIHIHVYIYMHMFNCPCIDRFVNIQKSGTTRYKILHSLA